MIIATLCYINDGKKTLMLHRIKKANDIHKGKWNGLGGKLEQGESPEECVIREVNEESGLIITNPKLRGIITFPKFDSVNDWLVFIYTVKKFKGNIKESKEGVLNWVKNKNLMDLNLWEGDKIFLKWLNKDKFFSAKFIYENKRLLDYKVVFYE